MSQFSNTRLADMNTAHGSNAFLAPAVVWLRTNTALGRLPYIEVFEALQAATTSGGFSISQSGHSVP